MSAEAESRANSLGTDASVSPDAMDKAATSARASTEAEEDLAGFMAHLWGDGAEPDRTVPLGALPVPPRSAAPDARSAAETLAQSMAELAENYVLIAYHRGRQSAPDIALLQPKGDGVLPAHTIAVRLHGDEGAALLQAFPPIVVLDADAVASLLTSVEQGAAASSAQRSATAGPTEGQAPAGNRSLPALLPK
ncbi:MAG: hypothetical protein GY873_02640 [Bosea sp.]|uniref:hypothetical protein n=1 Tax=Bosea sp. (in: a-proteobacteria) TaxID=1871050 RepID=UPI0023933B8C|nr:hypothetical protein [Bosea sp. (in: a-proteobacteria)]MCP4733067.1 hypothetical protein [Bosea sp. (in: a-proteobacteria)]